MQEVIVAFTGGLQSSVCLHWLRDHLGWKVKAVFVDLGQCARPSELGEYAVRIGAEGAHIEDCREVFCRDYAFRALKASAVYERHCLLSGALARPLIAAVVTRLAREEGCRHVALGAGSRSNDLAGFEANVAALAPELEIVGPGEIPPLSSRGKALEYAREHGIVPQQGVTPALSFDANLWGASVVADLSLGTWEALPDEVYRLTVSPEEGPAEPEHLTVEFGKGIPLAVDGEHLAPHELVREINERAGRLGVGRVELIEDRLAGIKARRAYEAPGATVLMEAHSALEEITLDYETLRVKEVEARRYAELVYAGGWFSPLRKAMDAFVDVTQERVSGEVRLKLFRGRVSVVGRRSPWSRYDSDLLSREDESGLPRAPTNTAPSRRASPPGVAPSFRDSGEKAEGPRR